MKRILITGKNSYIGNAFEDWISQWPDKYQISKVSVRDNKWRDEDWSKYDVVVNTVGIAHVNEQTIDRESYYYVNTDMAKLLAKKAKIDGVKQFIQFSSMSVFGTQIETIDENTIERPLTDYGKSKLIADKYLIELVDSFFKVMIIRPPMVYGEQSPGNYQKLSNISKYLFVIPNIKNYRSMIFIENLCEFVKVGITKELSGIYYPQNSEYVSTADMIKVIRNYHHKKTVSIPIGSVIQSLAKRNSFINKIFGNLAYSKNISKFEYGYNVVDFTTSIEKSEDKER